MNWHIGKPSSSESLAGQRAISLHWRCRVCLQEPGTSKPAWTQSKQLGKSTEKLVPTTIHRSKGDMGRNVPAPWRQTADPPRPASRQLVSDHFYCVFCEKPPDSTSLLANLLVWAGLSCILASNPPLIRVLEATAESSCKFRGNSFKNARRTVSTALV